MTTRPINLTDWQVRAALDGRLSLVVEPIKPQPSVPFSTFSDHIIDEPNLKLAPDGFTVVDAGPERRIPIRRTTGDSLWVREAWSPSISAADPWHVAVLYPCDGKVRHWGWSSDEDFGDWTIPKAAAKGNVSAQIMPRWASRLTLVVTDVKVMRVQEISEGQAIAAGGDFEPMYPELGSATHHFQDAWNTRHAKRGLGWDENPWVTATTVTVHRCNIDQMEGRHD